MRRNAKIDANQLEIVKGLRAFGCSVQSLAAVGRGAPDILAGFQGRNVLMELKDGKLPASRRRLTPEQVIWHSTWNGQVRVVETLAEAIEALL